MRFRTFVLLALLGLLVGSLLTTVGVVAWVFDSSKRRDVIEALHTGRQVLEDQLAQRQSLYKFEARVVADEPRLKAVVDSQDVNHETVLGVAFDLRKAIQSDLFVITDGTGHVLADVAEPDQSGGDMSGMPVIATALREGEAADVWAHEDHVYQVQARALRFGTTTVGVLVIGYAIDDKLTETVYRQTGNSVVVLRGTTPVATSSLANDAHISHQALATALVKSAEEEKTEDEKEREMTVESTRYLTLRAALPLYRGKADLSFMVLRSLDQAFEPRRRITRILFALTIASLLLATLLALRLAKHLSRPIDRLVERTRSIAAGKLEQGAPIHGPIEIETLNQAMNQMVSELDTARQNLAAKERLTRELEIATRIQTSILPRNPRIEGLEIATRMVPAEKVGGDYFDLLPTSDGAFIGIGDVAGHGLTAGLVMLMIQSIFAALARDRPDSLPSRMLTVLNATLFDNIHCRLQQDEHVTLTLMRYRSADGTIEFAGAHEEIILCRAADGKCEIVSTPGTWVGAVEDVSTFVVPSHLQLRVGDVMVLYTDGIIQAMDASGEQFGMDKLCQAIEATRGQSAEAIVQHVFDDVARFTSERADDMTLVVLRYQGASPPQVTA